MNNVRSSTSTRTTQRSQALHRHLHANEAECVRHNIIVRVDSINASGKVAFCTVEQRLFGICRRKRSTEELLYRAEQALAPLTDLGLMPMVTVLHPERTGPASVRRATLPWSWAGAFWQWLGYPFARHGYKHLLRVHDPFGWRHAMIAAAGRRTPVNV